MAWAFLVSAIVSEATAGALSLRMAATGRRVWYTVVVTGYLLAFAFLSLTLQRGIGIGVAYGIWTAAGVALTAVAGRFLFRGAPHRRHGRRHRLHHRGRPAGRARPHPLGPLSGGGGRTWCPGRGRG